MERLRQPAESGVFQYHYKISTSPVHIGTTIGEERHCLLPPHGDKTSAKEPQYITCIWVNVCSRTSSITERTTSNMTTYMPAFITSKLHCLIHDQCKIVLYHVGQVEKDSCSGIQDNTSLSLSTQQNTFTKQSSVISVQKQS